MGDGPGLAELAFRLVGSLALVVGLLFLIARLVNRRMRPSAGAAVQIVARQQLTRSAGVAVVTVGDRVLVVGTTEHQVSLLAEMEPDELAGPEIWDEDDLPADSTGTTSPPADIAARRTRRDVVPARREATGPLAGSVLSPQTWKQTLAYFSSGNEAARPGDDPPGERPAS